MEQLINSSSTYLNKNYQHNSNLISTFLINFFGAQDDYYNQISYINNFKTSDKENLSYYYFMNNINNDNKTSIINSNSNENLKLFLIDLIWHILIKLRFLFYLVWPNETMFSSLNEVPRYVTEMFPVFFFVAFLENTIRLLQGKKSIRINESIGSLSQGIFQECLRIKIRSIEVLMYCLIYENFRFITLEWNSIITWWLCYLSVDFGFYWAHRLAHEVNFIWAIHQAHHSSQEFSIVSALRQAVLQPFTAWFTYIPLAFAIPPQIFLVHLQLSELYMAWLHTEIIDSLGPLELILNTPSHHRVHHSRNPEYIDKNYGGMLIIWDKLFNTFKKEDKLNIPPVYGLVHQVKSFNPIYIQFHTWPIIIKRWKRYNSFKDKLGTLFMGPGWRPNSNTNTINNNNQIPKIEYPIEYYDPKLSIWKNFYILIHFGLLLFFYHELTLYQNKFNFIVLNCGILSLLASITSLGLILDDKKKIYSTITELSRCLLYFLAKYKINFIISYGLNKSGLNENYIIFLLSIINLTFVLSTILNLFLLIKNSDELNKFLNINLNFNSKINTHKNKISTTGNESSKKEKLL